MAIQTEFPADGSGIPIANSALTLVGTRLINDFTDTSKECNLVKIHWRTFRRAVLRDGEWKFAKALVCLKPDSGFQKTFGYDSRYLLPASFIRVIAFNEHRAAVDGDRPWQVVGNYIYTSMSYAHLTYVTDVNDVTLYDPLFCEAFSTYIAAKLCQKLTGSRDDALKLEQLYNRQLQKAKFAGSTEDPSVELDVDIWLQARIGAPTLFRDIPFAAQGSVTPPATPAGVVDDAGTGVIDDAGTGVKDDAGT